MFKRALRSLCIAAVALLPLVFFTWAADEMEEGKKAFDSKCAICHGKECKADSKAGQMTKTPDLTLKDNWKHGTTLADVEKVVREGAGKMKGFDGKLTDAQIAAVSKFTLKHCGVDENP